MTVENFTGLLCLIAYIAAFMVICAIGERLLPVLRFIAANPWGVLFVVGKAVGTILLTLVIMGLVGGEGFRH